MKSVSRTDLESKGTGGHLTPLPTASCSARYPSILTSFSLFLVCQCCVIDVDADERSHELGVHEIFAQEFLVGMAIRKNGTTEDKLKQCFHAYVLQVVIWYPLCCVNARMVRKLCRGRSVLTCAVCVATTKL